MEVHRVPGNHHTILMEPSARMLAQRLRACLDDAIAACDSRTSSDILMAPTPDTMR
jgi:hypothetical protein